MRGDEDEFVALAGAVKGGENDQEWRRVNVYVCICSEVLVLD